jgi:hypothetical protein
VCDRHFSEKGWSTQKHSKIEREEDRQTFFGICTKTTKKQIGHFQSKPRETNQADLSLVSSTKKPEKGSNALPVKNPLNLFLRFSKAM